MADEQTPITGEIITTARSVAEAEVIARAFIIDMTQEEAHGPVEPVYPITAVPEGMGEAITPASIAAACREALEMGQHWQWGQWSDDYGSGRGRFVPMIPVRHRWRVGQPAELWIAGGPCQSFPASYLAEWSLLLDDGPAFREQEARRRPAEAQGWRARWARRFPPSRQPELRPQDRVRRAPPGYFKIPRGDTHFGD
jgi:hypothetical protein